MKSYFYLNTTINSNYWHHLALSYNNGNLSVYFDGLLINSATVNQITTNTYSEFRIGGSNTYSFDFNGLKRGFANQFTHLDDFVDEWVMKQFCETEEQWEELMDQAKKIEWEIERDFVTTVINRRYGQWCDENDIDTLQQIDP